jgi:hypothetical protein
LANRATASSSPRAITGRPSRASVVIDVVDHDAREGVDAWCVARRRHGCSSSRAASLETSSAFEFAPRASLAHETNAREGALEIARVVGVIARRRGVAETSPRDGVGMV